MTQSLFHYLCLSCVCLSVVSCGGGGSSGENDNSQPDIPKINLNISPDLTVNATTSYEASKSEFRFNRQYGFNGTRYPGAYHGIAYGDFDNDGDIDVVQAGSNLTDKQRPYFHRQDSNGNFNRDDAFISGGSGLIHARKSIVGDYNNDGMVDVINFGHGLDKEPFAGEIAELYLSNGSNLVFNNALSPYLGYFHSGASGDIDNDGDIDILMGDSNNDGFYFLINDGAGSFTKASNRIWQAGLTKNRGYTSELIDVNKDGFLDLVKGGHEYQGMDTAIYYGNSTGLFENPTILPKKAKLGIVLDIDAEDINNDGYTDLIVLRTGDDTRGIISFYRGFYVQLLLGSESNSFIDRSDLIERRTDWAESEAEGNSLRSRGVDTSNFDTHDPAGGPWHWIDRIRVQDIDNDGDLDIYEDQDFRNVTWLNKGDGSFSAEFFLEGEKYFGDYVIYP